VPAIVLVIAIAVALVGLLMMVYMLHSSGMVVYVPHLGTNGR
jgi:hypothetical protein